MPRYETDREDLLAEATALVQRVELAIVGLDEHVVIGFRRDGCASIYCGADSAWHFNSQGQLRRAYRSGMLYKAELGRLVELERRRTPDEVQLIRAEVSPQRQGRLIAQLESLLATLRRLLSATEYQMIGEVPSDGEIVPRIMLWLNDRPAEIGIAATPHAR